MAKNSKFTTFSKHGKNHNMDINAGMEEFDDMPVRNIGLGKQKKLKQKKVKREKPNRMTKTNNKVHRQEPPVSRKVPGYLSNESLDMDYQQDNTYLKTLKISVLKGAVPGLYALDSDIKLQDKIDTAISSALTEHEFGESDFIENIDDTVESKEVNAVDSRRRIKFV